MKPEKIVVLVALSLVCLGALLVIYDLNKPATRVKAEVVSVEWGLLTYRPTYRVLYPWSSEWVTVTGSLTLDWLQVCAVVVGVLVLLKVDFSRYLS